jgi:Tol biopolymer transport system component
VAFVRGLDPPQSQLFVANKDGTDEHVVVDPIKERIGRFNSYAAPSWSPDGKMIAEAISTQSGSGILICVLTTGQFSVIPSANFVSDVSWFPDQRALLMTAAPSVNEARQVWQQPYPSGAAQRVTNDLNDYVLAGVPENGNQFVAVKKGVAGHYIRW